jgi:threonine/homoserine/homoserine lactone efflux protein
MQNFFVFLSTVVLISLSGVASPGPLTAVTVAKGLQNKYSGVLVSIGHGIVELPLIFLIYFGFTKIFYFPLLKTLIGLIGGIILIFLGITIFKTKEVSQTDLSYGAMFSGVIATISNPYFFIWWLTIGNSLILTSINFSKLAIIIFSIVHLLCDFIWYTFLSVFVYKTKSFFHQKVYKIITTICGILLILFGIFFIINFSNF